MVVSEITGTSFINTICIRWSSNFNAVQRVFSSGLEMMKMPNVIEARTDDRWSRMLKVLKKLPSAMTLMQGVTPSYLGNLIPAIMDLKCKLDQSTGRLVDPLVNAISAGIERHFEAVLSDKKYLITSVIHQQFKMNSLPEDARLRMKRQVLINVKEVSENHDYRDPVSISGEVRSTSTSAN